MTRWSEEDRLLSVEDAGVACGGRGCVWRTRVRVEDACCVWRTRVRVEDAVACGGRVLRVEDACCVWKTRVLRDDVDERGWSEDLWTATK